MNAKNKTENQRSLAIESNDVIGIRGVRSGSIHCIGRTKTKCVYVCVASAVVKLSWYVPIKIPNRARRKTEFMWTDVRMEWVHLMKENGYLLLACFHGTSLNDWCYRCKLVQRMNKDEKEKKHRTYMNPSNWSLKT